MASSAAAMAPGTSRLPSNAWESAVLVSMRLNSRPSAAYWRSASRRSSMALSVRFCARRRSARSSSTAARTSAFEILGLGQLGFRFDDVSDGAQFRGDEDTRARNAVRVRIDLRGFAQIADGSVVLAQHRGRDGSHAKRARESAVVRESLVFDDRCPQGLERSLSVSHPEIEPAKRAQFDGAFSLRADFRVEPERLGVQRERAVEIAECNQCETVVAEQRGVLIRLGSRIDERQQRFIFRRGLRNEPAKIVYGREIAE